MNRYCAIILAAGQGLRLQEYTQGISKQFLLYKGLPLYMHSVELFRKISHVNTIIVALPQDSFEKEKLLLEQYSKEYGFCCLAVTGGATRIESMRNAASVLPKTCDKVYIHDAARPFTSANLIHALHIYLDKHKEIEGVIPTIAVKDTIKVVTENQVIETPDRNTLFCVQTPQYFRYKSLMNVLHTISEKDTFLTDDSSLFEQYGYTIHTIPGEERNIKITTVEDLEYIKEKKYPIIRTTMGYDVHAYDKNGRDYILGGINIETPEKIRAHSDGDVVLHALIDALLACTDKGDIGTCFPDTDNQYDGISSALLLHKVLEILQEYNIRIQYVDITIVAQVPKVKSYIPKIKTNIAYLLGLKEACVSIKATTEEHLGFTGRKEGVKAYALVTTQRDV